MKFNVDRFLTDIYHYCEKARLYLAMHKETAMGIFVVAFIIWLGTRDFA
jgi:hypothetical protein